MKKKKVLIALSSALVIALAVGSSFALQTDVKNDVNVITTGDIEIAQHEYERATDENGKWIPAPEYNATFGSDTYTPDKLQPFTQNKTLQPAFYLDGTEKYDDRNGSQASSGAGSHQQSWGEVGAEGSNQLFDDSVKNVIDKFVFVENTGNNDAYYRTIIAIEWPEELKEGGEKDYIHILVNGNSRFQWEDLGYYTIDGTQYLVKEATYTEVLKPGEVSRPSLLQVYLDPKASNEDVELFKDSLDIIVTTQATQVIDGVSADRMLNAAFGDNKLPWEEAQFTSPVANNGVIELNEDLIMMDKSFYNDIKTETPVTIEGNGFTVIQTLSSDKQTEWLPNNSGTALLSIPVNGLVFSSKNGSKVTVNNLNIKGTTHSIYLGNYECSTCKNFNTEFNNVNIVGVTTVSQSANISPAVTVYGTATLNNTNIYGTKLSLLDQKEQWPVYDLAIVNYSNTIANDSTIGTINMWSKAGITLNNTSVDKIVLRGNMNIYSKYGNLGHITVNAGSTVDVIDLTSVTDPAKVIINIAEGGSVGAYVDNGISYDTLDAWKAAQ